MCISFEYPIKGELIFLDYHLLLRFTKVGCVCDGVHGGTQRGVWRCAEVSRGVWRCMEGFTEVGGGVHRGAQRDARRCITVCSWLPLVAPSNHRFSG